METIAPTVFETKFGFVPCDYEVFMKLKRLNFLVCFNERMIKADDRYWGKQSQNRVYRKPILMRLNIGDELHKTGYEEPPLNWPEPKPCPTLLRDSDIREDFRAAKAPVANREGVPKLILSLEEVDKMLGEAEKWYSENSWRLDKEKWQYEQGTKATA